MVIATSGGTQVISIKPAGARRPYGHLRIPGLLEFSGGRAPRRACHADVSAPCHPPPRAARCSPRLGSACLGGHDGGASPRSATGAGGVDEASGAPPLSRRTRAAHRAAPRDPVAVPEMVLTLLSDAGALGAG